MSKKTTISLVILGFAIFIIIGGVLLSSSRNKLINIQADTAPVNRIVRLNTYNMWSIVSSPDHLDPVKLESSINTLAKRENVNYTEGGEHVNSTSGWSKLTPDSLKKINPNIKVYRTYDLVVKSTWESDWNNPDDTSRMQFPLTRAKINDPDNIRNGQFNINATDDWWLRDANNQVVKENNDIWFVDIGRPGLKELFVDAVIQRNAGKGFDGMVFDYWWPGIKWPMEKYDWVFPPKHYANESEWFEVWQDFIDLLTTRLHEQNYRIIGNCAGEANTDNPHQIWQRSKIDGTIYEQWVVDWPQNGGIWLPAKTIEKRINAFNSDPLEAWSADYGLQTKLPDFAQKNLAGLAMYYIAIPQDSSKRSFNYYNESKVFWDPLWDYSIGNPVSASSTKASGKYFWSRKFTEGIVLFNYDSESISYTLDKKYIDINGKEYSGSIILASHTGLILKTAPATPVTTKLKKTKILPRKVTTPSKPKKTETPVITPPSESEVIVQNDTPAISPTPKVTEPKIINQQTFWQRAFKSKLLWPLNILLLVLVLTGLIIIRYRIIKPPAQ